MGQKDTLKIAFKQLMMRMFTSDEEMLSTIDILANEYEQVHGDSINMYLHSYQPIMACEGRKKKESS
jgi:hypothetical protein